MMHRINSKGSDLDIDLESGGTTSEEDGSTDLCLSEEEAKKFLSRVGSGIGRLEGYTSSADGLSSSIEALNIDGIPLRNAGVLSYLGDQEVLSADKRMGKEKLKKPKLLKPSKPPRPPKGPLLDAADMKLVKEISELATLKRKSSARIKALKKLKADKKPSFNSNLCAMAVTVVFCFIIFFQGLLGSRV